MTRKTTRRDGPCIKPGETGGKAGAGSLHKATARLAHEVRHERPMADWGQGCKGSGSKR